MECTAGSLLKVGARELYVTGWPGVHFYHQQPEPAWIDRMHLQSTTATSLAQGQSIPIRRILAFPGESIKDTATSTYSWPFWPHA